MNTLTEKLNVIYLNERRVKLIEPWVINEQITIPKNFESDLGTIPKCFWWFCKPTDIKYSAIIHDYEWWLADYKGDDYFKSNVRFFYYSQELDNICRLKASILFIVLQLMALYKLIKNK